jgi:hypothetical protein
VKKLEEGQTVTCFKCHKEGHKYYQCKEGMEEKASRKNVNKNKKAKEKKAPSNKRANDEIKNGSKWAKDEKTKNSPYLKSSLMYTKPTHKMKRKSYHYILEKKESGKVVAHTIGWRRQGLTRPIWVPKEIIQSMDGPQKDLDSQEIGSKQGLRGIWRHG